MAQLYWKSPLTHPIRLAEADVELVTLRDGAELLLERFGSVTNSVPLEHAIDLIMAAVESGAPEDIDIATNQLASFLRAQRLV